MSKESFDLSGSHFNRMAFVVLENKALCPMNIGFLAGVGTVFDANGVWSWSSSFLDFWVDDRS